MEHIKYIRVQIVGHTIVEFVNGSSACSCSASHGRGEKPNLRAGA